MKIVYAIRKELLEILHDRTMLAVLVAFPVFIMMFMGSSFGSIEIKGLPIGVVGPTNTTFSEVLFSGLEESDAFKLVSYGSEEEAMQAFRDGMLRAVIVVPEDFEYSLGRGNGSEIRIAIDNSDIAVQKAILASMGSVVQASSTNITRSYVNSAWDDMRRLNSSAATLASRINSSREGMESTRQSLAATQQNMSSFNMSALDESLSQASVGIGELQGFVDSERDSGFLNESEAFLQNASFALGESYDALDDAHARLEAQSSELNNTVFALGVSISALEVLRATTSDNITSAALQINIATLKNLQGNAAAQLNDTLETIDDIEELNSTLHAFGSELDGYEAVFSSAKSDRGAALSEASRALSGMDSSLEKADADLDRLRSLLAQIGSTSDDIGDTLDDAIDQIDDVDDLLSSLQATVEAQTAKDPETIAAPLSVRIDNQYSRSSFVDFIIPQVIAVSLLFSCFLLASISLVREKTGRTVVRLLLAPGSLANVVAAKIATITLVSLVQVGIIVLVAFLIFSVAPPGDIAALVLGTAISALVLSTIGMLIGFYARSESAAIQTSLLIAIPMLFLGNIIFSADLLPTYTQVLQQMLPLAHITNIFKVVLITSGNPAADVAALLSYFVLLAAIIAFIVMKRKDIAHYI